MSLHSSSTSMVGRGQIVAVERYHCDARRFVAGGKNVGQQFDLVSLQRYDDLIDGNLVELGGQRIIAPM